MTMLETQAAEVEDPEAGSSVEGLAADGGGELVLPDEVVAELAGRLAERARCGGPAVLTGPDGLLSGIIGQVLQAGLAAELDAHLDGDDGGNRRNGSSVKTLNTEVGPVRIAVPRDREGSFAPALVAKQATRSDGLNAVIISLYAKGMSVRDIARHVRQTTGVDLSHDTVSRVTDGALEGMREWQHRPPAPFRGAASMRWSRRCGTGRRCGTRR
jgi:putative transposase